MANKAWFKPLRHSYIAINYKGALSYIPFTAYIVASALVPFHYLKPFVLAVFVIVANWLIVTYLMTLFARYKSS